MNVETMEDVERPSRRRGRRMTDRERRTGAIWVTCCGLCGRCMTFNGAWCHSCEAIEHQIEDASQEAKRR